MAANASCGGSWFVRSQSRSTDERRSERRHAHTPPTFPACLPACRHRIRAGFVRGRHRTANVNHTSLSSGCLRVCGCAGQVSLSGMKAKCVIATDVQVSWWWSSSPASVCHNKIHVAAMKEGNRVRAQRTTPRCLEPLGALTPPPLQ